MPELTPEITKAILAAALALHLLHHRLAKRHVSFVEVASAALLLVPAVGPVPAWLLMGARTWPSPGSRSSAACVSTACPRTGRARSGPAERA